MTEFKDYYWKLTLVLYVVPTYHKNNCIDFAAYEVLSNSFDTIILWYDSHFISEETEVQFKDIKLLAQVPTASRQES